MFCPKEVEGDVCRRSVNADEIVGGKAYEKNEPHSQPFLWLDFNLVFTLDRVGRPVTIAQGANTTALAYNDSGQTVSETFNGLAVTNDYHSLLRRLAVAYSVDAVRLVKNGYDAASRLTGTTNGAYSAVYTL